MENFCCIDNNEILNNKNFQQSFIDKNPLEKHKSFLGNLPSTQIKLGGPKESLFIHSASKIPILTKDVIVAKKGDPFEDYEIISKLGEGTYGKVFKVKNKNNNSIRAMKQIGKDWISDLNDNEVMKEIEILKNLNHPYIIKLYEYYVTDDSIFLISELCNEGDLHGKIQKLGFFPEFIVKIIMLQVFKALSYLNEKSIIHGDLKLENIMVEYYNNENINDTNKKEDKNYDGFIEAIKHDMNLLNREINTHSSFKSADLSEINDLNKKLNEMHQRDAINSYATNFRFRAKKPDKKDNDNNDIIPKKSKNIYDLNQFNIFNYGIKLIDFGCSKMFNRTKKNFSDIIGTLVYCSPEVLANNYNETCDIWSSGVLMYCLLCGHFPFEGESEEEIVSKILSHKFEFDIESFNGISEEAKDLISKCLIYDPNKRINIHQALNHRFFNDLKEAKKFTAEDKIKLSNLKKLSKHSKFYQLVLTYLSYNFSDNKLLNELAKLYDKLDKNNDYKITKAELYRAYNDANIPINKNEIDDIVNSIDFDMNGTVDYEEFIRMCIPKEKLFTEANLENAFLLFDTQKKGFITPTEIADFIQSSKHVSNEIKEKIKEEILNVSDEIIDCEEFKKILITMSNADY